MEPWPVIDELILECRILPAIQEIRADRSCGLPEALEAFHDRYQMLRATCPEDFAVSEERYFDGFAS